MKKAILATKVGMTQIFNADGVLVPVTVLEAGPCSVTQIKTVENDGYSAVQVAFADKKEKVVNKDANGKKQVAHRHGVNKAQMGHFAKAGVSGKRFVKEFKFENAADYKVKVSRALSRDWDSTEVLWLTVPSSIVIRVPMVHAPHRAVYSREKECRDTWEAYRLLHRTLKS